MALTGAGLIFISAPASPASTDGGGDSPSYSGFFHYLAVSDDQSSPCFSPNSCVLQNVQNAPSMGLLSRVAFFFFFFFLVHPVQLVFYLHDYLFANKLIPNIIVFNYI